MTFLCTWLGIACTAGTLTGPANAYDGDTIYVANQPVRLAGIDAEEINEPQGKEAKWHLNELIAGQIVTCDWEGYSYKRKVGVCFVHDDGRGTLNASMVMDGFALACDHYNGGEYRPLEPAGIRLRLIQKGYC